MHTNKLADGNLNKIGSKTNRSTTWSSYYTAPFLQKMGFFSCVPQWYGDYTKCTDIKTLEPADQIAIWDYGSCFRYQHHGIIWKAGDKEQTIKVCHIWSPFENMQESQADSHFRISTLEDFLYHRPLKGMRVIEYNTSGFRRCLAELGEVHPYPNDCPEIVLARCKFLMGLGKGEFDIFTQNCEHAAHWCQTGVQFCSQVITTAPGSIPFKKDMSITQEQALHVQIAAIKDCVDLEMKRAVALSDKFVYVRVKGTSQYLKIDNNQVKMTLIGEGLGTRFRIHCKQERYDRIRISFYHDETQHSMCSRGMFSKFRDVRMRKNKYARKKTGAYEWELRSTGHLVSERQHRRYLSIGKGNILQDSSLRGDGARFVLVPVDDTSVIAPDLPDIGDPITTLAASQRKVDCSMPKINEEAEMDVEPSESAL